MDLAEGAQTMSLSGESKGTVMARLDEEEQHTVMYIAVMPNLLISLHPDYIMSHLLTPIDADNTFITCSWAFPPAALERPDFDAVVRGRLLGHHESAGLERVRVGAAGPARAGLHSRPAGPRRGRRLPLRLDDGREVHGWRHRALKVGPGGGKR